MCEIVMLIFGIIALVRGRFLLTRAKEVRGLPARLIGVVLLLPWPVALLAGMVLGAIFLAQGKPIDSKDFQLAAQLLGVAIVVLCLLSAIGIAIATAKPIRKHPSKEEQELDLPRRYRDHFQADEEEPAPRSNREDVTGQPPKSPAPPDDRIQG
jgi:hypothetical protein